MADNSWATVAEVEKGAGGQHWTNNAWLLACAVFIAALAFFVASTCRTVFWWDSGELIANAQVLGIAHRPGFPLYILVARVFGLIPFGDYFYRINFISALSGAVSLAVLSYMLYGIAVRWWRENATWEIVFAIALSITSLGGTYTFWMQSVRAEVYAPNLLVLTFLLVAVWRFDEDIAQDRGRAKRYACLIGWLSGLGLALHHATFASVLPGVVIFLLWRARRFRMAAATTALGLLFVLIGASVYLYLPIRALQNPPLNWGWVTGVTSPDWSGVAAADAFHYLTETSLADLITRLGLLAGLLEEQVQAALITLGAIGVIYWWSTRARWLVLGLTAMVGNLLVTALLVTEFSDTNADIHGYLLPSVAILILLIAAGTVGLIRTLRTVAKRFLPSPVLRAILVNGVVFLLILTALTPGLVYSSFCDLADNRLAYHMGTESIAGLTPDGVVFVAGTNLDFVLRGLQHAGGWRPDVTVINRDLMPSGWYRHWLFQNHPRLAAVEIPSDSNGLDLRKWGVALAKQGVPVYWEFTERDMRLVPHLVPAGHLFELVGEPVEVLGPVLLQEQEEFERRSQFYANPEQVTYDYDAKMVWVMNLYRAGMYYESRGLLTRAKELYQRALSLSPYEADILMAYTRVSPSHSLPRHSVFVID
ncbi:MAG: hypothetical protein Kow0074_14970 [Candidatus Zixiibacteriota bacterium]